MPRVNEIPIKFQHPSKHSFFFFFAENKLILKFIQKFKQPSIAKTMQKKNTVGGFIFPDVKTYYEARVMKIAWCWHKYRRTDQWNRIKSPVIHSHIYGQLVFSKGAKTSQYGKNSLFNKWCRDTCRRIKLNTFLTPGKN